MLALQQVMTKEPLLSSTTIPNDNEFRNTIVRLSSITMAIVLGTFAGLVLFIATNWLILKGGPEIGPHLSLLSQYFPGYRVTFLGSLLGFAYAFVIGFVAGLMVGRIYNYIVDVYID